ncbi:MAG: GNAT family N-acetyltransferase [Planctomycetes bacterium]|nr:GNAT family N-acetyltransferase [Planctomycetota bacterium]
MSFPEIRAYRLLTERLELTCYQPEHAEELQALAADNKAHISRFLSWGLDEPQTLDQKLEWIRQQRIKFDRGEDFAYRVQNRTDSRMIGGAGLRPKESNRQMEIGYWVAESECGRGIATELTAALTRFSLETQQASRILIQCQVENEASNRIPAKLGFCKEGIARRIRSWPGEGNRDLVVWTLLPEELTGSPSSASIYEAFDELGQPLNKDTATRPGVL